MNLSKAMTSGKSGVEMPQIFVKQRHYLDKPTNSRFAEPSLSKITVKSMHRGDSTLFSKPSQPNLNIYTAEQVQRQFRPIPVGSGNCSVSRSDLEFVKHNLDRNGSQLMEKHFQVVAEGGRS